MPNYEHVFCSCGGIIGMYDKRTFTCEQCKSEFSWHDLDFDACMVNDKTGWIFPVKRKVVVDGQYLQRARF